MPDRAYFRAIIGRLLFQPRLFGGGALRADGDCDGFGCAGVAGFGGFERFRRHGKVADALEHLVADKNILTPAEMDQRRDAWDRAARATPHGEPIVLGRDGTA